MPDHAGLGEALPPPKHLRLADSELFGESMIRASGGGTEDDASAKRGPLRGLPATDKGIGKVQVMLAECQRMGAFNMAAPL
jgi:hypothetical protein